MHSSKKYIFFALGCTLCLSIFLLVISWKINRHYYQGNTWYTTRTTLLKNVFLATPANVPAGRNIAFEVGNAVSNAPASYLTMLDCCESDEAIADRIAVGQTRCTLIRKK